MKLEAPAAQRNREPIAKVLGKFLPSQGLVLEVASGTGEHAVHFAARFPALTWQPSDAAPDRLESIRAWVESSALPNLRPPLQLDVSAPSWPLERADALLAINLLQVSPPSCAEALFAGAARTLPPGGLAYIYSPLSLDGQHTSEGNVRFDEDLRARNPSWGVRDAAEVEATARAHGFELLERVPMPAHNTSLVFRKQQRA